MYDEERPKISNGGLGEVAPFAKGGRNVNTLQKQHH